MSTVGTVQIAGPEAIIEPASVPAKDKKTLAKDNARQNIDVYCAVVKDVLKAGAEGAIKEDKKALRGIADSAIECCTGSTAKAAKVVSDKCIDWCSSSK